MVFDDVKCNRCDSSRSKVSIEVFLREGRVLAVGTYGSQGHDGDVYEVVGRERETVEYGLICDGCLAEMISNRSAVKVTDHAYFGLGDV